MQAQAQQQITRAKTRQPKVIGSTAQGVGTGLNAVLLQVEQDRHGSKALAQLSDPINLVGTQHSRQRFVSSNPTTGGHSRTQPIHGGVSGGRKTGRQRHR